MTKTRRVILLVTNILTLLMGVFAFLYFGMFCYVLSHSNHWSDVPSLDKIHTTTNIYFLRNTTEEERDGLLADYDLIKTYKWYVLIFGAFLFINSVIHFFLTPWKLKDKL